MNFTGEPLTMQTIEKPWQDLVNNTHQFIFGGPTNCALATGGTLIVGSFGIMLAFFLFYQVLRPIFLYVSQPGIMAEILAGIVIGRLGVTTNFVNVVSPKSVASFAENGITCYGLLLGLSFDVTILAHVPHEAIIAYSSIFSTLLVAIAVAPMLHLGTDTTFSFVLALSVSLAGTSSPVLTRLLIERKFAKSDIGQLVIRAGTYTDLVTMILLGTVLVFLPNGAVKNHDMTSGEPIVQLILVIGVSCCLYGVIPYFVNWLQKRNPNGKQMRPQDMSLFVASLYVLVIILPMISGYSQMMSSFVVGLCFPRKGRLMSIMVRRFHEFIRMIVIPMYFCWVGANTRSPEYDSDREKYVFVKFFFLHIVVLIGKVLGALASGILLRFHWDIAIAMGLFLNVKGHFHIFVATFAHTNGYMGTGSFVVVLLHVILSILVVPYLTQFIIRQAKMKTTYPLMALQWFDPNTELRMLVGIHGHHNVQTMINFMEISRGNRFTSISAYVTDMIEMNDNNTAMFIPENLEENHQGDRPSSSSLDASATMADESVVSMRDKITNMILSYVENSGGDIKVHRLLAISTFSNMHHDIYNLAEAVQASLIILPYHKNQRKKDGKMGNTHHGFRFVNRKVFRHAPCSVGVLVDRGLGKMIIERDSSVLQVAVLFIGGKDDREALAYASQITQHPAVNLTAVRFLQDEETALSRAKRKTDYAKARDEKEMNLDNEYFASFYEKQVALRKVYLEKHVGNGKEIVSILKSLENQHSLFIVGRGGRGSRVTSFLESGVSDSEESPDLGPIGEILADSDFSTTASVLVIQQHFHEEIERDEFKIIPM
ncbi:hypothetical protein MKW94_020656 [Papaver nudicaule]|uniref:Cation/H+ exchanger domain-containing protein n=1 Tax=Papaver nudicaule TaxID=74823 RepID=A0AA41VIK0_PAPNU|nr:hypothetical protein [Papaver nudicaule]